MYLKRHRVTTSMFDGLSLDIPTFWLLEEFIFQDLSSRNAGISRLRPSNFDIATLLTVSLHFYSVETVVISIFTEVLIQEFCANSPVT